jgi:hypothetical protein
MILREMNNYQHKSQIMSDIAPFLEERSFVQVDSAHKSVSIRCLFLISFKSLSTIWKLYESRLIMNISMNFALNIDSQLYGHIISCENLCATQQISQKNHDSSSITI